MAIDVQSVMVGAGALGAVIGGGVAAFKAVSKFCNNGKAPYCNAHSGMEAKIDAVKERLTAIDKNIEKIFELIERRFGHG